MSIAISVIVPTCHRDDLLAQCLSRLAPGAQDYPSERYEVIVSDDGRRSTAENLIATKFPWARWVKGPQDGPAANRNSGAQYACGEWLAFVDDDCLPDKRWLEAIASCMNDDVDVVEGQTIIPDKVDSPFLQGVENVHGGVFWSCNLAVRRATFQSMGGFDSDFKQAGGEDMEFAWRLSQNHIRTRFCREALVLHPLRRLDFKGVLWRTFLIRWMLLYYYKTGQAVPLTESNLKALGCVFTREVKNFLRGAWHFYFKTTPEEWRENSRTRLFYHFWGIVSFPVVLPYMLLWELRFRKQLRARLNAPTTGTG